MTEHNEPFIQIDSDFGKIGNIHWYNGDRETHLDICTGKFVKLWGYFLFNCPEPGIRYADYEICKDGSFH